MFTPQQAAAYDAWRTAGPPEDPAESIYERQAEMCLDDLCSDLEDSLYSSFDDEDCTLPRRKIAYYEHNRRAGALNAMELIQAELTSLYESPLFTEDGDPVDPTHPTHASIDNAETLLSKAKAIVAKGNL